MTDNEKLIRLKLQVKAKDNEDELLQMHLSSAASIILNRLYPMSEEDLPIPHKYDILQVDLAVYLYNKMGAEGEVTHNENGINRGYESASVPESMLADIIPHGKVIK